MAATWAIAGGNDSERIEELITAVAKSPHHSQFATAVSSAAETSLYPERIVLLANSLRDGLLAEDNVVMDLEYQVVSALNSLDRPHLQVLQFLSQRGDKAVGTTTSGLIDRATLNKSFPQYGTALTRILGVLSMEALATAVTEAQPGQQTYAEL